MYKEIILENNLTVIYERLNHLKSVSFGVWIGAGSRNEMEAENGISHFIEHMVFKGTEKRSAKDIACDIDKIGGQINAFTGKDCTCFYTKTLDSDLETAVDVLSDMLFHSVFDPKHIETEKKVVYEEISMYEDDPEELVHDLLTERIWSDGPLGYPILGTQVSLGNLTRESLFEYMSTYYIPDNCLISVVGNFEEEHLLDIIRKYFGAWKPLSYCRFSKERPVFKNDFVYRDKDTEQTHLCMGFRGLPLTDRRVYPLMILNNIIGGGMSSRLFQSIREELGLVYSVYSFPTSFRDCGMFTIYAATNPDRAEQVIERMGMEVKEILKNGITETELIRSKNQLKGSFILGLDSTSGRMSSIGKNKLITGVVRTPEEILMLIDQVTTSAIHDLAQWIFGKGDIGAAVLGSIPVSSKSLQAFKL